MKKLNEKKWRPELIGELFAVGGSRTTSPQALIPNGYTPRITCASVQNGLDNCYQNMATEKGGVLTVDSATVGTVFYQPYDFIATDHVEKIQAKVGIFNECKGLFLQTIITHSVGTKYQYGYKFSQKRIKQQKVILPMNDNGKPDYGYMEEYIYNLRICLLEKYKSFANKQLSALEYKEIPALDDKEWGTFILDDVFSISSGTRLETRNKKPGTRPFIGAADNNNGVTGFVSNDNASFDRNVLGVNYNGNGMCIGFYHPYDCIFSDDVKRFHLKNYNDNKFVLLFFKMIILQQKSKFGYLYKFNAERMSKQRLLVPINSDGKPDYLYMEQYAKNMMLKKYQQYLAFLETREK
ncbi:MAG: restriction endonuclease subunit S [Roseburia sp.]|nr:restriction endonuclease subunit S [Roseburia sp.]